MTFLSAQNVFERQSPLLSFSLTRYPNRLEGYVYTPETYLYTSVFPHSVEYFGAVFPSVLETKCFNPHEYTFPKELEHTQLTHLFEHILLEKVSHYLKTHSLYHVVDGVTKWDWKKNKRGIFLMEVTSPSLSHIGDKKLQNLINESVILLEGLKEYHSFSSQIVFNQ